MSVRELRPHLSPGTPVRAHTGKHTHAHAGDRTNAFIVTMFVSCRCNNLTGGWRSLSASEGRALLDNITEVEERGVTKVTSDVISVMSSVRD